ncbi:putative zinc-type alcohol dehydrogenase-like protein [Rhodococcus fascians]|uniref:NAD(P)-dependent alcohol dehydrogenase n=1 Tax=Nocardiaceae TaxID=85025 RepID=UPI00050C780D|nr:MULTISPECIES: NAD(P)-dependent alcohol dehydrogenase [Rhodococcus]RZL72428.1 MAG: NAD(P)-dependent alcohol dehydrogenase [Rhodococcus sp. (in: high G+C Gram-positive bacteria)]KQU37310.1 alcohol dehydrogenase [Rhodococcus sp. Leaf233]MDR6912296.1 putative zinc-type alcohol dehydrogenase-like protein [Rhodococcus sp. 3258]MDR6934129.1 putative zinc-type alcohol dehydrogenase-like protein [Rhodococcus fascians]NIL92733.1 NADP-dependent alcohol dehydrogenase C 1 [Rhodococcus fascians]
MTSATAYQATAPDAPLEKATIERRAVGPHDILIDVKFAGICHSDIHTARNEWGGTTYPVVPGHEIAGIVAEVGSEVTTRKVGDRVGVGCFVDSCGKCEACLDGDEQYCTKGVVQTYNSTTYEGEFTNGGYSTQIVVTEKFVLGIPEGVELDVAAPLLCAGITLYSPLKHWGAGPDKKVAIIGMGGLGHIGVKIAHAMGAHVTVLSQTDAKEADGKAYGADEYYATKDTTALKDLQGKFDLILNTVSANLPMGKYLGLLARNGTLVELGVPEKPLEIPAFALLTNRRSFAGSMVGGIAETQEMLDFCAEHHIGAEIEVIPAEKINEAYDRVVKSDVRYRFVIDAATL